MRQSTLFQKDIEKFEPGEEQLVETSFPYQTKKILFNVHYKHNLISFEQLKTYLVEDRVSPCQKGLVCNNSGKCYSCPPLSPTLEKYNRGYKNALVYAFYVDWDFKMKDNPKYPKQNQYFHLVNANRTLSPMAWNYGQQLEKLLGGVDCIDGRCPICVKCNYPKGCLYPTERRCSMESLGLDASRLSKEILNHEILWYIKIDNKIQVPKYLTVIHSLITNSNEPKTRINY